MKMYRENFGFNNFNKKILLSVFSVCIFFFVFFLSVGFSAFELDLVMKDITAEVKFYDTDAIVSSFKSNTLNGNAVASNTDYNYNRIYGDIVLPDTESSVLYEVQVVNLGNAKIGISSMTGLDPSLEYTLTGYTVGDPIMDENGQYKLGTTMTFYITIKYAEGATPVSESQAFNILIDFRQFYTITYHGVPGEENFPTEIIEGRDLVITTPLNSIERLKVTEDTAFLTYNEDYIYDETLQQLTVKNVEGNLLLSYRDVTYLANLSSPTGFFKENKYKTNIKNIYFVNYVDIPDDDTLEATYDLSESRDSSITAWIITNGDTAYDLYIGSVYDIYTKNFEYAFSDMTGLRNILFENLNTSESTSFAYTFYRTKITALDLSTFNTSSATTMADMFGDMTQLETLDVSNFNTENVKNMWYMFGGMTKLKELDISSFNTSSAENMGYMFSGMSRLQKIKFGPAFTASQVTIMECMFNGLSALKTLDLSTFKTDKLQSTKSMFYNCDSLTTLNLSTFNTSKVTTMSYMFYGMDNLETLDVSSFDTSKVTAMNYMFSSCPKLTKLDLKHFDTSLVTTMEGMFDAASGLTELYLNNFKLLLNPNMNYFARNCASLKYIDFRSADFTKIKNYNSMLLALPSSVEIIVADENAKTWIQGRLGTGRGTIILVKDLPTETET